jgi:hypothetical protein
VSLFALNVVGELCRYRVLREALFPVEVVTASKRASVEVGQVLVALVRLSCATPPTSHPSQVQDEAAKVSG